ncbi:MAG: CCA tRNA nucleotidyltransferase [Verrucomicrobia bacterium]|nr:CCA tRNA nucleotidyltransferase [Verrucomicrobiota bacterium]
MDSFQLGKAIVERLVNAGHTAYFAGGFVRDYLLRLPSSDIDIATSASPQEVMQLFEKTVPVGLAFGSVLVVEQGRSFEVTTFRFDGPYLDGRHPSYVRPSDARADAQRRSFTINGMFYDPIKEEVLDYVEGKKDLQAGIIRTIGEAKHRFEEDKLRMIRAVRFAVRLGFTIEANTAAAIKSTAAELRVVSVERIWQELAKAHDSPRFPDFLLQLHQFGLLEQIMPPIESVEPLYRYPQEAPTIAFLVALRPHASLASQLTLCDGLKVAKKERQWAERFYELKSLINQGSLVAWAHFYALEEANLLLKCASAHGWLSFEEHQVKQQKLHPHIERLRTKKPLVNAKMLIEAGVSPGVTLGKLLEKAEKIAIEENLNDPQVVLARVIKGSE